MGFLEDDRNFDDVPTIPQYYTGKSIFITGGSGFMGKILIEKLLYSCSDLNRIYLLLRCKKGVEPEDRFKELYDTRCFDRLRNEKPGVFESKVTIIPGDVMEIGLGISEENRKILINNVNIIFHVAASVRFDDPMVFAVKMNLRGTNEMVQLAEQMKKISALVHVSTSYSNTNRNPIEEIMYPPHANWRDVLQICEEMDEHTLRTLTPKMLGELPNTYAFTKQLAEHVMYERRGQLPVVIFRPSIVISSVDEPMKGWIENFNGPVALLLASGKGIMRSLYTDPDLKADYIPVDFSIKAMIAAAWVRGTKPLEPKDDIPVYNCCSGQLNNITMGELVELGRKLVAKVPLNDMLWNVGGSLTTSLLVHNIKFFLLHLLPALFVDSILCLLGKKPILIKVQRRIYIANQALVFYLTSQWTFDNKNLVSLRSAIKEQDRAMFYYDIENVEREEFFYNGVVGAKKYLLKEKDEDLPRAKAHYKRMKILDNIVQTLFYGCLLWWFINLTCVQNFIQSIVN